MTTSPPALVCEVGPLRLGWTCHFWQSLTASRRTATLLDTDRSVREDRSGSWICEKGFTSLAYRARRSVGRAKTFSASESLNPHVIITHKNRTTFLVTCQIVFAFANVKFMNY